MFPANLSQGRSMTNKGPWELYDTLCAAVPEDAVVSAFNISRFWALAKIDLPGGAGLAHVFQRPGWKPPAGIVGSPAREIAALVKSWDFETAALGMAVINAALNAARLKSQDEEKPFLGNAFDILKARAKDKKVAVIGHFPRLDAIEAAAREIMIFERNPQKGDYPDSAAEYLLPEAEVVFMTGSSAVNKTMPRLLELSKNAEIHLVGPSVPLLPGLLADSIASLSGLLILDYGSLDSALDLSANGSFNFSISSIRRVTYLKSPLKAAPAS